MYQISLDCMNQQNGIIYRSNSNKVIVIPMDPNNTDYQEYLEWVAEGNTPLPADSE